MYDSKIAVFRTLSDKILTEDVHFAAKIINDLRQVMLRLGYVINENKWDGNSIFFKTHGFESAKGSQEHHKAPRSGLKNNSIIMIYSLSVPVTHAVLKKD